MLNWAAQKPAFTKGHKATRLRFTSAHATWTAENWEKVIFSDELSLSTRQDERKRVGSCNTKQYFALHTFPVQFTQATLSVRNSRQLKIVINSPPPTSEPSNVFPICWFDSTTINSTHAQFQQVCPLQTPPQQLPLCPPVAARASTSVVLSPAMD